MESLSMEHQETLNMNERLNKANKLLTLQVEELLKQNSILVKGQ